MNTNYAAIILAAGKGTRIGPHLPKPLYPIAGRPMIHYTMETMSRIPIKNTYIVVGFRAEDVKASIGDKTNYVYQKDQLGTGHALELALEVLHPSVRSVLVVYGDDSAFYEAATLRDFIAFHESQKTPISLISHYAKNPTGLGRIIRGKDTMLQKIVEEKEATEEEKTVNEVNTGCYIFDVAWAKENIHKITKSISGEYFLTDAIELALTSHRQVSVFPLPDANEWMGVNTKEQLAAAHSFMVSKLKRMHLETVVFVDLDNTILDTQKLKENLPGLIQEKIMESFGKEHTKNDFEAEFFKMYEINRNIDGFVNVPELCNDLTAYFGLNSPEPIKSVFYSQSFKNYLLPGSIELLEFIHRWSRVVLFVAGDLVYQPVKSKNLDLQALVHDVYFAEKKTDLIPSLLEIYGSRRMVFIDDQIRNLEQFEKQSPQIDTIWLKKGPYQQEKPLSQSYKPAMTARSLSEVLALLKRQIFEWA